ncbi:MAG: PAS domain-containing protein, partial [Anaerolineae bacterium]|nr:PAS domain-containing protein [Anaerolineae bacterium]
MDAQELRSIFDTMPDLVLAAERDTLRILYANRAVETATGHDLAALCALSLPQIVALPSQRDLKDLLAQIAPGQSIRLEAHLLTPDSTPASLEVHISLHTIAGMPCLVCVLRDIGGEIGTFEQEIVDPHLLNRKTMPEDKYESLMALVPDTLCRFRRDGMCVDFRPGERNAYYRDPTEVVGQRLQDLAPPELASRLVAILHHVLDTGHMETVEYQLAIKGAVYDFEARIIPTPDDEVLAIVRDVSEQKRIEVALCESEETARALLNASVDSSLLLDAETLVILAINEAGARRLGHTVEEMIGQSITAFLPPDTFQTRLANGLEVLRTQKPIRFEDQRGDFYFDTTIYPLLDSQGEVARVAIIGRDITAHRQAENALRRQSKLLEGAARATQRLLEPGDHAAAVSEALAILGEASGVEHVYIFQNHRDPATGHLVTSHRYGWWHSSDRVPVDSQPLQSIPWRAEGGIQFYNVLASGEALQVVPRDLPEPQRQLMEQFGMVSALVVPIVIRDALWGQIGFIDYHAERQWSDEQISVLKAMAASFGAALERQRIQDDLLHQREVADTLREIGTVLSSTLDLDEVFNHLLDEIRRIVPYDAANVMLIEGEMIRVAASTGYDLHGISQKRMSQIRLELEQTPIFQEMQHTCAPYVCPDVRNDPSWIVVPEVAWIRSWLGVPIVVEGQIQGYFSFDSATPGFYGPEHAALIAPVSQQAAQAFHNAQLFAKVRAQAAELTTRLEQLSALYTAGQAVLSTLESGEILNRLAEQMTHITDSTCTIICDYDPESISGTPRAMYCHPDKRRDTPMLTSDQKIVLNSPILQAGIAAGHGFVLSGSDLDSAFSPGICGTLHTMMIVPLFSKARMTGLVMIGESRPDRVHSADGMWMCEALA